jgi:RNA polymerase sigma-B factor
VTEETRLIERWQQNGDHAAREQLVERYRGLVRALAARHSEWGEPFDDLLQVAWIGFLKALDRFDPGRGESFVAYAAPTILGELRRHFRDRVWGLRLPRDLQERTLKVQNAATKLGDELGHSATPTQIAQLLELSEEEVTETLQADRARRTLSLDAPSSREDDQSTPMVETVGRTEGGYEAIEVQAAAAEAELTERERSVLQMRFEEDLTQYEIGDRIGVSQMQVSRIMRGAFQKLLAAVIGED